MASPSTYQITWASKPLGFSIVMDTTGRNAYVSSIQKTENVSKGLKLASQIVSINGADVKGEKHQTILQKIINAVLPMVLEFQPRTFANDATNSQQAEDDIEDNTIPKKLLLGGAPESARNRVDGMFELKENEERNGRNVWERVDNFTGDQKIVLYWWPAEHAQNTFNNSVWMIARRSMMDTQNAYACVEDEAEPLEIQTPWRVWNQASTSFVECELHIAAKVAGDESKN